MTELWQASPRCARLGLGTAQFGLDYGVTNLGGKVSEANVGEILHTAAESGMTVVDTAPLYGVSEAVLGRSRPSATNFRVITKTPKFGALSPDEAASQLRLSTEESLRRLGVDSLAGQLVHDPTDLLSPAGDRLWSTLEDLRSQGLVQRIGVSVYTGAEIDCVLARFPLTLIQLPFNPLDRRLKNGGQLERLAAAGVEVHARSLFLQGLLLQPTERIDPRLRAIVPALRKLDLSAASAGLSRLEAIFTLAFAEPTIGTFLCGVTSAAELKQLVAAAARAQDEASDVQFSTPEIDERLLNPARWSELV